MTETAHETEFDTDHVAEEQDPLTLALAEAEAFKDKYLRAVAEMQNIQKRAQRDLEDSVKYAGANAAKHFLSVADNLSRALSHLPAQITDETKNFIDGIQATHREMQNALEKIGVVMIAPQAGEALNPHEHEVMFEVPVFDQQGGLVAQVLETGYKIQDRLLRPARVSVTKQQSSQGIPPVDQVV